MPLVTALDLFQSANKLFQEQQQRFFASKKTDDEFYLDPIENQIRTVANNMRRTAESILMLARIRSGDNGSIPASEESGK